MLARTGWANFELPRKPLALGRDAAPCRYLLKNMKKEPMHRSAFWGLLLLGLLLALARPAAAQVSSARPAAPATQVIEADTASTDEEMEEDSVEVVEIPAVAAPVPLPKMVPIAAEAAPAPPAAPAAPAPAAPAAAPALRPGELLQQLTNYAQLTDFQALALRRTLADPADPEPRQRFNQGLSAAQQARLAAWETAHPSAPRLLLPGR